MKILIQILKITILSLAFAIAIHFSYGYLGGENATTTKTSEMSEVQGFNEAGNNNKYNFKNSDTIILANVGVALTTNIGTKFKERGVNNLYQAVPGIAKTISYKEFSDGSHLSKHMLQISEYYNVSKTDIKLMLDKSYSKGETLNAYIDLLEYRYKSTVLSIKELELKKVEFTDSMALNSERINKIKIKIDNDFRSFDAEATNKNIEYYLETKSEYNYARTQVIFINQYLKQYRFLNEYNKKVLDALINNKDAIIKNSYVVIPDTGIDILKKMNLIISEQEFKSE